VAQARRQRRTIIRLWETLDLSLYAWKQLGKTGNLRYLIRNPKQFDSKHVNALTLRNMYYKLMDDYFELVGEDADRQQLVIYKKKLTLARCLLLQGELFQANWIKMYEGKIEVILTRNSHIDPEEQEIIAAKWLGNGLLDDRKISVYKYVKLWKTIEKENALMAKHNNKNKVH